MTYNEFTLTSGNGTEISAYSWIPGDPVAAVQISHGAVEHARRYDGFARFLAANGFAVYADDHRGHGKTAGAPENVTYLGEMSGGFLQTVEDMRGLTARIKNDLPGLPVFLLGHSMGSLMSRVYASKYGEGLAGLVLTGTGRVNPALIALVRGIAKTITALYGRRHRSPLCHKLVFGTLNRPFKGETGSEFISSDDAVVKAYASDEYCGNTATAAFIDELLYGTRAAFRKETFENTPKDLPLFIGAGEFDTMGGPGLKEVKKDVADYRKAGMADFEFHIYEGMRHEVLNEKDKQRVYDDILAWLKKRITGA
jgi:alpha-beta hydrolase superfamily lysophospholipase